MLTCPRTARCVAALVPGAWVLLGACAPPPLGDSGSAGAAASIEILFPEASEVVEYCSTLIVVVDVDGITLAPDSLGGPAVDGQGHWHLLDSGAHIASTGGESFRIEAGEALADGRHFLSAELVRNDHQSFSPAITSSLIEFEVVEGPNCVGGITTDGTASARSQR